MSKPPPSDTSMSSAGAGAAKHDTKQFETPPPSQTILSGASTAERLGGLFKLSELFVASGQFTAHQHFLLTGLIRLKDKKVVTAIDTYAAVDQIEQLRNALAGAILDRLETVWNELFGLLSTADAKRIAKTEKSNLGISKRTQPHTTPHAAASTATTASAVPITSAAAATAPVAARTPSVGAAATAAAAAPRVAVTTATLRRRRAGGGGGGSTILSHFVSLMSAPASSHVAATSSLVAAPFAAATAAATIESSCGHFTAPAPSASASASSSHIAALWVSSPAQIASLVYGEVTIQTLGAVLWSPNIKLKPGGVFYDLGSGTGRGVFAAALLHNFDRCVGIEIMAGLHNAAGTIHDRWNKEYSQIVTYPPNPTAAATAAATSAPPVTATGTASTTASHPHAHGTNTANTLASSNSAAAGVAAGTAAGNAGVGSKPGSAVGGPANTAERRAVFGGSSTIVLQRASFLDVDWSDADVVFINSTCFDETLLSDIGRIGLLLKDGTYVITLTKRLKLPAYRLLDTTSYMMSWGYATVHVQQKIATTAASASATTTTATSTAAAVPTAATDNAMP